MDDLTKRLWENREDVKKCQDIMGEMLRDYMHTGDPKTIESFNEYRAYTIFRKKGFNEETSLTYAQSDRWPEED